MEEASESKPRRRAVRSDRDYKEAPLVSDGPLPVVNVAAIASGEAAAPEKWITPTYTPPRAEVAESPWIEYWDESPEPASTLFYFVESIFSLTRRCGRALLVQCRIRRSELAGARLLLSTASPSITF